MLNKYLTAKVGWNLLEGSKDWVNIFQAEYLKNKNPGCFLSTTNLPNGSILRNHLIKIKNVLKFGVRKRIGNGKDTNF